MAGKKTKKTKQQLLEELEALQASSMHHESSSIAPVIKKLVWSDAMIQTLLEFRLEKYREAFSGSKSASQLAVYWEKVRLAFNVHLQMNLNMKQLKDKYNALKKQFSSISEAMVETGNRTEEDINFPSYWEILVQFMGDRQGLGNIEFASTKHSAELLGEDSNPATLASATGTAAAEVAVTSHVTTEVTDDVTADLTLDSFDDFMDSENEQNNMDTPSVTPKVNKKRKLDTENEIKNQRESRKNAQEKKKDIAEGLIMMGESLASGLETFAKISSGGRQSNSKEDHEELVAIMRDTAAKQETISKQLVDSQSMIAKSLGALVEFMKSQTPGKNLE